jgi:hypothetical protein
MTTELDAWDECAACGHDREEHDTTIGGCYGVGPGPIGTFHACPCRTFTEDAA